VKIERDGSWSVERQQITDNYIPPEVKDYSNS
jgi:hypothetical protein